MNSIRGATSTLIQLRLAAYDQALKEGASKEEAMAKAKAVTRKQARAKRREGR